MTRNRALAVLNLLVVFAVVAWNGWTSANGFRGRTVGGMSAEYRTLFTPAGYAFSIWGLIFFGLLLNGGYQLWVAIRAPAEGPPEPSYRATLFERLGPWLIVTNLANILWVVLWLSEYTAASVVTLATMVACLTRAMWRLDMATWDAPFEVISFVWWPLVTYAGWCAVAVLANLSAYLAKEGWVSGDSVAWSTAMVAVATGYNLFLIWRRNLREHALVAVWALVAIASRQAEGDRTVHAVALAAAVILGVTIVIHAYLNRHTLSLWRRFRARHARPDRAAESSSSRKRRRTG
ncbi:MAG: tryptophan-rich sensory protein [Myxococcota bacterium]